MRTSAGCDASSAAICWLKGWPCGERRTTGVAARTSAPRLASTAPAACSTAAKMGSGFITIPGPPPKG